MQREREFHPETLERIAEQTQTYKAKVLISRAGTDMYHGNIEGALSFYAEALRTNPTPVDFIKASTGIATLKSIEGFNRSALRDLEKLLPLIRHASPLNYFEVINSYAVVLTDHNRLSEAESVSQIAVSSPFGPFYPEWQETLSDIRTKRKHRSTVAVSRTQIEEEYAAQSENHYRRGFLSRV